MKNKSLSFLKTITGLVLTLVFVFGGLGFISVNKADAAARLSLNVPVSAVYNQIIEVPVHISGTGMPIAGFTVTGVMFDDTKLSYIDYIGDTGSGTNLIVNRVGNKININQFGKVIYGNENDLIKLRFRVISDQDTVTSLSFSVGTTGVLEISDEQGNPIQTTYSDSIISLNGSFSTTTPPNPPTNVMAFAGNHFASVQFRVATTTGSSTIVRYTVTSYPGNISINGVSSPILVTGLTNGTSYTFRVTATDANGNTSEPSIESNVVRPTGSDRIPGVPTNLTATPGNGQVVLTWSAPTNNEELPFGATYTSNIFTAILSYFRSTPAITDYIVEYKVAGATTNWIRYNDGVSTNQSALVRGLSNGTQYSFVVSAEVDGNVGSASNVAYATPRDLNTRPIVTVIAVPNPITSGLSANIIWTSTNSTSCSVTHLGTTTIIATGSSTGQISTGPLLSNNVYTVTCLGRDGLPPGVANVTVNVARSGGSGGGLGGVRQLVPETDPIAEPVVIPTQEMKQATPEPELLYKNQDSLSATILNAVLRLLGI